MPLTSEDIKQGVSNSPRKRLRLEVLKVYPITLEILQKEKADWKRNSHLVVYCWATRIPPKWEFVAKMFVRA